MGGIILCALIQRSSSRLWLSHTDAEIVSGLCERDGKLEFYYLSCAVLWEPLSYLAFGNSLGEENVVPKQQNGRFYLDRHLLERTGEERRGERRLFVSLEASLVIPD